MQHEYLKSQQIMKKLFFIHILFLFAIGLSACSDNDDSFSEPDLYKLGEYTEGDYTILAYANRPLEVGYNTIYLEFLENGEQYDHPHIHFNTMMHMAMHNHASPYDEPGHHRGDSGLFEAWAIFTMPGNEDEYWELEITVHDHDHQYLEVETAFRVDVAPSNNVKMFTTEGEQRYILTLVEPRLPETGMNELNVALHQRSGMMNFPPVLSAEMTFEPWMPAMDHGSANNVAPTHDENGFYKGQVNFNMTGFWELRFEVDVDEETHPVNFEMEF